MRGVQACVPCLLCLDATAVLQYDPVVRQHVLFTEVRISRTKPR